MVLVRWLHLDSQGDRLDLMGAEELVLPVRVNLLDMALRGKATVSALWEPRVLEGFEEDPEHGSGVLEAPDLASLSNRSLAQLTHCTICTPWRLLEDGQPMHDPSPSCVDMLRQPVHAGRFCQEGARLEAFGLDESVPGVNGHTYTLIPVPTRATLFGYWLVPGDCAHLPTPGWMALPLRHGASSLALAGLVIGDGADAVLELDLSVDDELVQSWLVPMAELAAGPLSLPLDSPLTPEGKSVTLRLGSAPGVPFVMLTGAELRE